MKYATLSQFYRPEYLLTRTMNRLSLVDSASADAKPMPPEAGLRADFHWQLEGLNKGRFQAWTKLLLMRFGRQVEKVSHFSGNHQTQSDFSEEIDDMDSTLAQPVSAIEIDELRRKFLDRFAEFSSHRPGVLHISASAMTILPDRMEILLAQNGGLNNASRDMMKNLESHLRRISQHRDLDKMAEESLWQDMVVFYRPRLNDYIYDVKNHLDSATIHLERQLSPIGIEEPVLRRDLVHLSRFLSTAPRFLSPERQRDASIMAYDICNFHHEQDFFGIIRDQKQARKLRRSLSFLARIRRCFLTFIAAAERIPLFATVNIIEVPLLENRLLQMPRESPWSAAKTLQSLGLSLDIKTVTGLFGEKKLSDFLDHFKALATAEFQVHAEVQIVLALAKYNNKETASQGSYIGCSRRSCLLCTLFLRAFGSFSTRACHGKIYDLWNIPDIAEISTEHVSGICHAITYMESAMRELLLSEHRPKLDLAKESSAGETSISNLVWKFDSVHLAQLVVDELERQRDEEFRAPDDSNRDQPAESVEGISHDIIEPPDIPDILAPLTIPLARTGACFTCDSETSRLCEFCRSVWFCTSTCQDLMDIVHLRKCCARPITTADYLVEDVHNNVIPADPETREDFGFEQCRNHREEISLLGVYQGLVKVFEVNATELHEWRQNGTIFFELDKRYCSRSEGSRGGYFPWLQENKARIFPAPDQKKFVRGPYEFFQVLERARHRLALEDQDKILNELEPRSKNLCFLFYAYTLEGYYPPPNGPAAELWYEFGFATCKDERAEGGLGALYQRLIGGDKHWRDRAHFFGETYLASHETPTCHFDEFWRAWVSGEVNDLFDKYGLTASTGVTSDLRHFLSFPHGSNRPSIWRLKHMLLLNDNTPPSWFNGMEAAAREYGFTPRLETRVKIELREFYRALLKEYDPLDIQEARNLGNLDSYSAVILKTFSTDVHRIVEGLVCPKEA